MRSIPYFTKFFCGVLTASFAGLACVSIQACASSDTYPATPPAATYTNPTIADSEPPYPPAVVKTYYGEPVLSYGFYDSNGVWHYTGRYDANGVWHYGYYDEEGIWHDRDLPVSVTETHREYGYYDANGDWHETSAPTVITQMQAPTTTTQTIKVTRTTITTESNE